MNPHLQTEFTALREHLGMALVPERALLRVTGEDSTRWLNGMLTNSVSALEPGEGAYSFALNAQGRIQGDCTVYRETAPAAPASFLLSTTATQVVALQPWLHRYIIMDDVELTRAEDGEQTLLVIGPALPETLPALGLPLPEPLRMLHVDAEDGSLTLLTPSPGSIPRVELRASPAVLATWKQKLTQAGSVPLSPEALHALRVLEGLPQFGTDIRDRDLPQETGQTQALHFNKGCYLGQEIVERIRSRGQVHRTFTRLLLSGTLPGSLPAALEVEGRPAGEITSAAEVPSVNGTELHGLGYVRREMLGGERQLRYAEGTAVPADIAVAST